MSFYDDYVEDGLCCNVCGAYIDGEEPGFPRTCDDCLEYEKQQLRQKKQLAEGKKKLEKIKKELEANNINYVLKNENTGHFHTRRKFDNQLIEFYAFTGKISIVGKIQKARGIKALIQILLKKGVTNENTSNYVNNKSG